MNHIEARISRSVMDSCPGLSRVYVHLTRWMGAEPYPSSAVVMAFTIQEVSHELILDSVSEAFRSFAREVPMARVKILASRGDVLQDLTPECGGRVEQSSPQSSRIVFQGPGFLPAEDEVDGPGG